MAREDDLGRARVGLIGYALLGGLQCVALLRYSQTPDWSGPSAWLYLLVVLSVLGVGLYGWARARRGELARTTLGATSEGVDAASRSMAQRSSAATRLQRRPELGVAETVRIWAGICDHGRLAAGFALPV